MHSEWPRLHATLLASLALLAAAGGAAPAMARAGGDQGKTPVPADLQTSVAHAPSEEDLRCLTLAVAYEAGNQPVAGQEAVAEVVLNRTRHPSFPRSVCGVVFQGWTRHTGCQFTFACDGAIDRRLPVRILAAARGVAERVASGASTARVAGALNYHANYVNPAWASHLDRIGQIGAHIFYRPEPGGTPESGRTPLRTGDELDGLQAIRRYASYFDQVSAGLTLAAIRPARDDGRPEAPRPFAPWGLSLR